jgi:hypothetical protein
MRADELAAYAVAHPWRAVGLAFAIGAGIAVGEKSRNSSLRALADLAMASVYRGLVAR